MTLAHVPNLVTISGDGRNWVRLLFNEEEVRGFANAVRRVSWRSAPRLAADHGYEPKHLKILVTGADSVVGKNLLAAMSRDPEVMGVSSTRMDFTDSEPVLELFVRLKPVAVIHAGGLNDADECETQPWEALRKNVLSTHNLVLACQQFDSALALISTHHVFSGSKRGPYTEWDLPDPQNVFGHSKYAAEMTVRDHLNKFHIFRTQGLFSSRSANFVARVLRCVVEERPIVASNDEFILPTWTRDFAEAVAHLVRDKLYGIYHLTNTGERTGITWADWARIVLRYGGSPDHPVEEVPTKALNRPARRPPRAILGNTFYRLRGHRMRSYEEAISAFFKEAEIRSRQGISADRAPRATVRRHPRGHTIRVEEAAKSSD